MGNGGRGFKPGLYMRKLQKLKVLQLSRNAQECRFQQYILKIYWGQCPTLPLWVEVTADLARLFQQSEVLV